MSSDASAIPHTSPAGGRHVPGGPVQTMRRGFFWVGVHAVVDEQGTQPAGQMYVEWMAPETISRAHPVVLIHGGGGQGTDWLGTPDGRPGWAQMLVGAGFAVYVVDRPAHGRSPYLPASHGPLGPSASYEVLRRIFLADGTPQADGHDQWPGTGQRGDEAMDQFAAGAGPMRMDSAAAQLTERDALAALLDRTGPSIVISHSAGGPAGWLAADARPDLVTALIAVEPLGPPFLQRPEVGLDLRWGLTAAPMTYEPAVLDPDTDLHDGSPRRFAALSRVPVTVVTAPHSLVAQAAPAILAFLRERGCSVEELRLEDLGIAGNGHGMMLERNNDQVFAALLSHFEQHGIA